MTIQIHSPDIAGPRDRPPPMILKLLLSNALTISKTLRIGAQRQSFLLYTTKAQFIAIKLKLKYSNYDSATDYCELSPSLR